MNAKKAFTVNGCEYRPCEFADSRNAGYRWYAVTLHGSAKMEWSEQHSPKFRTKAECIEHSIECERSAIMARLNEEAGKDYFKSLTQ